MLVGLGAFDVMEKRGKPSNRRRASDTSKKVPKFVPGQDDERLG